MFGCMCKTWKVIHINIQNKDQVNIDNYYYGQELLQARAHGALPKRLINGIGGLMNKQMYDSLNGAHLFS